MKYFYIITLLFISSLFSCGREDVPPSCKQDSDCFELVEDYKTGGYRPILNRYCGYAERFDKKVCMSNHCKDSDGNELGFCGLGVCIPCGKWDRSCERLCHCPEGTVSYNDESSGKRVCVPKCDSNYTGICEKTAAGEFKDQIGNYRYCDVELGHCAEKCNGEGSCPDSFTCEYGFCRSKINCEKNEDCSSDETYVCGIKGKCTYNPCNKKEPPFCGSGKCVGGGNREQVISDELYYGVSYTCDCDDNTILTDKGVCMLKCTKEETCRKLKFPEYPKKYFHCNTEKGHCEER